MPVRFRLLLIISAVVLVLDQATKLFIDSRFALYESLPVIDGFFAITYVRNKGAAFGMLADSSVRIPFFISVAVIAALGILWYLGKLREEQRLLHVALALVFSGAVGNLIDRIRLGEVIDFLDVYWRQYHWPAFNVADSAICVGVGLMLLDLWREERRRKLKD
ncbi:lipoprotein signal peptidase [Desulfuromonas versatilis]|uniref:Lipoprotein signal peptidase n=1 Tax=Desulfuromonas versatilis TaxID=2802975 RepID=A0ABM8HMM3_9BACT|nr:signal peptidase II [Desulfuromonas versatilis]BCR03568.1 lipoprotein signal peptidase [Desulfuromonas versatilis]